MAGALMAGIDKMTGSVDLFIVIASLIQFLDCHEKAKTQNPKSVESTRFLTRRYNGTVCDFLCLFVVNRFALWPINPLIRRLAARRLQ